MSHISFEEICREFEKHNFTVITNIEEFDKPYTTKINYRCPQGHIGNVKWYSWKRSRKCKQCSIEKSRGETTESVRNLLISEGYTLLSEYTANKKKLHYICPKGHKHHTYISNWRKGCRCGYCTGKYKLYIPEVIDSIENEGYRILTKDIEDSKQLIHTICPKGHNYHVTWDNWNTKYSRCSKCQISLGERELKEYVDDLTIEYIDNDRSTILNPLTNHYLELDLWFPELNKGIEFNGTYWHSKPHKIKQDKLKRQICEEKGIELLVVWEDNWNNDREGCKIKIKEFLK